jgi:hypothetical protein
LVLAHRLKKKSARDMLYHINSKYLCKH